MAGNLYRRTEAGTLAWQRQDARVPLEYRRILGLIDGDTHADTLRACLARYSETEAHELLDELVNQGLLQVVGANTHHDLDFTGQLDFSGLRKR
jgi:hypothetical protein